MDELDRRLLSLIQRCVPLDREPYAQLAGELGCGEQAILDRLGDLRRQGGLIREISGIFDAAALGYAQVLAAFQITPERLDAAGQIVGAHPGVSHCYARSGVYNLWFTLATSQQSRFGVKKTAQIIADRCGAGAHMVLGALRRYKINTHFVSSGEEPFAQAAQRPPAEDVRAESPAPSLTDRQMHAIRALQMDLPTRRDPFAPLAASAEMDTSELLVCAADFLAAGWMRRYAAVLHHRLAGAKVNVMVVWRVSESAADAAGAGCAALSQVSHCYLRQGGPDWPYNFYTMIHGRSRQDCAMTIDEIITTTHLAEHVKLWTTKEYKKRRIRLFSDEEAAWEARQ